MSDRFDAHTSVLELPGIDPDDVSRLQRLRVFNWGDLVALDSAAAILARPRSLVFDIARVARLRRVGALADDRPDTLATALGIQHLGFRTYLEDALATDEEPDVLVFDRA